jgi:hypothetical protein
VAAAPENTTPENAAPERPRRVQVEVDGPILIEGPVEIHSVGEEPLVVDRFVVAVCTCRRSRRYPLCDGSHRRPTE